MPASIAEENNNNNNSSTKVRRLSNKSSKNANEVKIVLLGTSAVGKSALVVRFMTRRFIWEYDPTLEFTYQHQTLVDEDAVAMEILDTAGVDDPASREGYIKWADGFIMVYSVTDKQSFEEVKTLRQNVDDIRRNSSAPCVIIGNKIDLVHTRKVTYTEGEKAATNMGCAFFETSACQGSEDIYEAFHELYREIKRRKMVEGKPRRRSSAQQLKQVFSKVLTKVGSG